VPLERGLLWFFLDESIVAVRKHATAIVMEGAPAQPASGRTPPTASATRSRALERHVESRISPDVLLMVLLVISQKFLHPVSLHTTCLTVEAGERRSSFRA
jgi:hypothetical protein